ncbi:hypothetical protein V6N13_066480 [Hibiscus sabdariffa]|uniref:Uncharacterized protein n=1 Tax=Hibiscus sabdariffa TaxID=183260 RepID=A0ABR2DQK2_9ROSI
MDQPSRFPTPSQHVHDLSQPEHIVLKTTPKRVHPYHYSLPLPLTYATQHPPPPYPLFKLTQGKRPRISIHCLSKLVFFFLSKETAWLLVD